MLTNDEAELYDRQIRLWGVNAQSRLRQSKVLMLGFTGTASEVAKILVLAGIDTLTIIDDQPFKDEDLSSNLFCRTPTTQEQKYRTMAAKDKLKSLNPLVKVEINNLSVNSLDLNDFKDHDLVTLHEFIPIDKIISINKFCRSHRIKFYLAVDFGFYGFVFNDLGPEFKFSFEQFGGSGKAADEEENQPKKKRRVKENQDGERHHKVETLPYCSFEEMLSSFEDNSLNVRKNPALFTAVAMVRFFDKHRQLPQKQDELPFKEPDYEHIKGSLSPVCAVVGGVAGQDMIRVLSNKDIPLYNTFSFDGINMTGLVERVGIKDARNAMNNVQPAVRDILEIDDD